MFRIYHRSWFDNGFNTLILLNQTCAIAKRFLLGDRSHMTCLLKEQTKNQSNKEK